MRRLKSIALYSVATGAMAVSGIVSVPLLVRLLSLDEFARWTLVEPILVVAPLLSLLGVSWGVFKLVAHDGLSPGLMCRSLLPAAQPMMIAVAVISAFVLYRLGFSIAAAASMAATVWLEGLLLLQISSLRAANNAVAFSLTQTTRALAMTCLLGAALFGWIALASAGDVILVRLLVAVAAVVAATVTLLLGQRTPLGIGKVPQKKIGLVPTSSSALYRDAIRYGAPLLVTSLLTMVLQFFDRYLINAYFDNQALAQYFVYVKISNVISMLFVTPFALWWPHERFRLRRMPDGGRIHFPQVATLLLVVLLTSSGILWLITGWLLPLYAPGIAFNPEVLLLLLFGGIFAAMAYPLNVGLLEVGHTHKNVYAVLLAAAANVGLGIVLIPRLQLIGAALAYMLGYSVFMVLFCYFSQRVFPVVFAFGRMIGLAGLATLFLWGISSSIPGDSAVGSGIRTGIYLCAMLVSSWLLGVRFIRISGSSSHSSIGE